MMIRKDNDGDGDELKIVKTTNQFAVGPLGIKWNTYMA